MPPVALLTVITTALSQGLLIHRAYQRAYEGLLTAQRSETSSAIPVSHHNKLLTGILAFLVTCQFASVIAYYAHITVLKSSLELTSHTSETFEKAMNIVFLITDSSLAASLTFLLWRMRSGIPRTDSIVRLVMIYTLSTSLCTTAIAVLSLVTNIVFPQSFAYLALDFIGSKCKCDSLRIITLLQIHFRLYQLHFRIVSQGPS